MMNISTSYFATIENNKFTHGSKDLSSLEEAVKFALKHSVNADHVQISKISYDRDAIIPITQREIIFDINLKED